MSIAPKRPKPHIALKRFARGVVVYLRCQVTGDGEGFGFRTVPTASCRVLDREGKPTGTTVFIDEDYLMTAKEMVACHK